MQKVLIMCTAGETLRSEAVGWSAEDGDLVKPGPIGRTPGVAFPYTYDTPLHALGAGWRLLSQPTRYERTVDEGTDEERRIVEWEWWFVKD